MIAVGGRFVLTLPQELIHIKQGLNITFREQIGMKLILISLLRIWRMRVLIWENRIRLISIVNQIVFVPVYNYKGYHVFGESGREYAILNGDQNHLGFELPDNFDGIVTVKFQDPVLWTVSLYISVLTGIILIIFRFAEKKKRSKETSHDRITKWIMKKF